jgi:hypothetical protein
MTGTEVTLDKSYRKRAPEPPKRKKVRVPLDMREKCEYMGWRDDLMSRYILDGVTIFIHK